MDKTGNIDAAEDDWREENEESHFEERSEDNKPSERAILDEQVEGDEDNGSSDPDVVDSSDSEHEPTDTASTDLFGEPAARIVRKASSKRQHPDHDAIDARIHELSHRQISHAATVKILRTEFGVVLSADAVGRRHRAFLATKRTRDDAELDADLKDWHKAEDSKLQKCYQKAQELIELKIQRLREKLWSDVSDLLTDDDERRMYSARACRERHDDMESGTAMPPVEEDPDPLARAAFLERERSKYQEHYAALIESIEAEKEQALQEHFAAEAAKQERRIEKLRVKAMKRAAYDEKENERQRVQAATTHNRLVAQWIIDRMAAEDLILSRLIGKARTQSKAQRKRRRSAAKSKTGSAPGATPAKKVKFEDGVTLETLENARSIMSMSELEILLVSRGLPRRGPDEDHAQLVARIDAADKAATTAQLDMLIAQKMFRKLSVPKDAKVAAIQNYDARHSTAGNTGITSTDDDFKQSYEMYAHYPAVDE